MEKVNDETAAIMQQRFGKDCLIALATLAENEPAVRTVDAFYEDGAFYTVTYALSGKMQQIANHPRVAVCGEWFTGRGIGENLGHVLLDKNAEIMDKLRKAFAAWYGNGHVNEQDPHTCILKIALTDGVLMHQGKRYEIQF